STWAAVCMRPRRCWRARARRCVGSMRKDRAMPADPLDSLRLPIVPIEPRPAFADALLQWLQEEARPAPRHETPTIRYFVQNRDDAVTFHTRHLGFEEELRPNPAFAMLYRGDLRLLLSAPGSHALPDGTLPTPGGWNRILIQVDDLDASIAALRQAGVRFV